MSGRGAQDEQPSIARRVEELENYCDRRVNIELSLSLEGVQERIAGIPPDAVRGSEFFCDVCRNEGVTLEMIELLLDAFPDAARSTDDSGGSPLHNACANKNMDPGIVRLLLDRWPESVNHRTTTGRVQSSRGVNYQEQGGLPLHILCNKRNVDETDSLAILDLLLAAAPDTVTLRTTDGFYLPIHTASLSGKPLPFCKRLIDAYPESLRVRGMGMMPVHFACSGGDIETVKYIIERDPESIGARSTRGSLPIHTAAGTFGSPTGRRSNGERNHRADIIRYLLTKDPDCASKEAYRGHTLPIHLACKTASLESACLLFDAYPEAINRQYPDGRTLPDIVTRRGDDVDALVEFLEAQLVYARLAEDTVAMTTPDDNGWLPLHRALRNDAPVGAIKLLIAGSRDALHVSDNQSAFPLHTACEFSTVGVVKYILGLSDIHLHTVDAQSDSTLHYACRSGNIPVVKYLLERGVPSVSEPNDGGKLPIHLLWESDRVDHDSLEYVEAVWRLLLAHPETVVH